MGRRPAPCGTETRYRRYGCRCDACVTAHAEWYEINGPAARERAAAWKKANPERAKVIASTYRAKHRERLNAEALERYHRIMAEDPEQIRALRRAWVKTDRGVVANRLARHARRGAPPTPEARAYSIILLADPCSYCGGPGGELDHVDPVGPGGDGEWINLTAACRSCNASKNDHPLLAFLSRTAA